MSGDVISLQIFDQKAYMQLYEGLFTISAKNSNQARFVYVQAGFYIYRIYTDLFQTQIYQMDPSKQIRAPN